MFQLLSSLILILWYMTWDIPYYYNFFLLYEVKRCKESRWCHRRQPRCRLTSWRSSTFFGRRFVSKYTTYVFSKYLKNTEQTGCFLLKKFQCKLETSFNPRRKQPICHHIYPSDLLFILKYTINPPLWSKWYHARLSCSGPGFDPRSGQVSWVKFFGVFPHL